MLSVNFMQKNKLLILPLFATMTIFAQEIDISKYKTATFDMEKEIATGDIEGRVKIKGTPLAYETYDIYAPFDGRIDEVRAELFDLVYPSSILAREVNNDLAALLDTANTSDPESKKQILKKWKGTFDYFDIKCSEPGIVVHIFVKPKDYVKEGDKLFTIAKKMQFIAVNTEPIYTPLETMMKASMHSIRNSSLDMELYLRSFVPFKDRQFFYRLWLDVKELKEGMRVGDSFEGELFTGRSENAKIVDRTDVIVKDGKRYLLMEIKPGLMSDTQLEVLSPTKNFLAPKIVLDSKPKKTSLNTPPQTEKQMDETSPKKTTTIIKKKHLPAKAKKTQTKKETESTVEQPKTQQNTENQNGNEETSN